MRGRLLFDTKLKKEEVYSMKLKATCHVTSQSKNQCTRIGSAPNLNSQASSPFKTHKGQMVTARFWFSIFVFRL